MALYGEERLKSAMQKCGVSCGCVITEPPFYSEPEKFTEALRAAFELAARMGADTLMVVPGITEEDRFACFPKGLPCAS